jgi:cell division septation protein DedD
LKEKGYKAYILVSDLGARGIWYRVRVGPFTDEAEARKTLESITQEFKSGIIVTE